MASISGPVWLIIGIVMAGFSWFVERTTQKSMLFFIIVAGIFVFVGIVKIIWSAGKSKKPKQQKENKEQQIRMQNMQQQNPEQYPERPNMIQKDRIIVCPNCGAKHYSHSNFCHMCGARLKMNRQF